MFAVKNTIDNNYYSYTKNNSKWKKIGVGTVEKVEDAYAVCYNTALKILARDLPASAKGWVIVEV